MVEGLDLSAATLFAASHAVYGVTHLGALCRLLPERDPHPHIHAALEEVLGCLIDARLAGPRVVRFELQLLSELGFGLDLDRCAATGATDELVYVSPRSGRAVSREAGRAVAGQAAAPAGLPRRSRPGAVRRRSCRWLSP